MTTTCAWRLKGSLILRFWWSWIIEIANVNRRKPISSNTGQPADLMGPIPSFRPFSEQLYGSFTGTSGFLPQSRDVQIETTASYNPKLIRDAAKRYISWFLNSFSRKMSQLAWVQAHAANCTISQHEQTSLFLSVLKNAIQKGMKNGQTMDLHV